jgi:hypothetical protein
VEADEMYQHAGEKGRPHRDPDDPPRRRALRLNGHGTFDNDRPLVNVNYFCRSTTTISAGRDGG